jgi:ribose 5-phosphate isomerase RpiB
MANRFEDALMAGARDTARARREKQAEEANITCLIRALDDYTQILGDIIDMVEEGNKAEAKEMDESIRRKSQRVRLLLSRL